MLQFRSPSLTHTHAVAAAIAGVARRGDLIVLAGEMGAGKTSFAQGFAIALGVTEPVTSPTFNLLHSYEAGRMTLHHADVYRLSSLYEVADLALGELLETNAIVLVEWGDVVAGSLGDHLAVRLDHVDDDDNEARDISVNGVGRSWASRWQRLDVALAAVAGEQGSASSC